ncbi:hypothetical protein T05_16493 [Trichinella murrelli]|uniref:Uncharacterized protein n=1 Tax=Trichinella murrelli TaxID=144512 RepID=A0A0V0TNH2_9BILA|nr:hypothetical protein T05_16493 [Trichinella murrelli]
MPLTNIVRISRHITYVGEGDFDTMEKSTRISLQQNICDIEIPKAEIRKANIKQSPLLVLAGNCSCENSIRVCPVYIGSDGANKRCFLHFYPSDLTVD